MKKRIACLLALALALLAGGALAQTLPSNACFSPGLTRLAEQTAGDPALTLEAAFRAEDALYARDLSVLNAMLDGTTIRYEGGAGRTDALTILRGEDALFSAALTDGVLRLGDRTLDVSAIAPPALSKWTAPAFLAGAPILERVPLTAIARLLEEAKVDGAPILGVQILPPFDVARTMSDDGARLTRIDVEGSVRAAGRVWRVKGFLRQPAGRAPKDTFELTATCDEENALELSYSAVRENEIKSKNKQGEARVTTALKIAGKLGGYGVSTRLNVRMRNAWRADGESLDEKITVTASLTHRDQTPGRRMQRLNAVDAESKNVIRLSSKEGEPIDALTDEAELSIKLDENTFLAGSMALRAKLGGEPPAPVSGAAQAVSLQELRAALDEEAARLSAALFAQLPPEARKKAVKGLDERYEPEGQ